MFGSADATATTRTGAGIVNNVMRKGSATRTQMKLDLAAGLLMMILRVGLGLLVKRGNVKFGGAWYFNALLITTFLVCQCA